MRSCFPGRFPTDRWYRAIVTDHFTTRPLTPERFDDLATVLGRSGISGCWCMYWIAETSAQWSEGAKGGSSAANKQAFREIVEDGPPPGLIAYDGREPVAWCRVMARSRLPGLARSRHFKTDLDIDGVWSLPCFVVRRSHRGRGLTRILIEAAKDLAREQGAAILEAYPWDTDERQAPMTVYTGIASTFRSLGFTEVQRRVPHKPMMRVEL